MMKALDKKHEKSNWNLHLAMDWKKVDFDDDDICMQIILALAMRR